MRNDGLRERHVAHLLTGATIFAASLAAYLGLARLGAFVCAVLPPGVDVCAAWRDFVGSGAVPLGAWAGLMVVTPRRPDSAVLAKLRAALGGFCLAALVPSLLLALLGHAPPSLAPAALASIALGLSMLALRADLFEAIERPCGRLATSRVGQVAAVALALAVLTAASFAFAN
jgi:hypothetical protein